MPKKTCLYLVASLLILPFGGSTAVSHFQVPDRQFVSTELDYYLDGAADYCEKLYQARLDFICKEEVFEDIYFSERVGRWFTHRLTARKKKFQYLYDYQMIRSERESKEIRFLLEKNWKKQTPKKSPLISHGFFHTKVVLGPYGLLGRYWQKHYKYQILGKENIYGTDTIIIEATPKPSVKVKALYGKIWICRDDFTIYKIEWTPQSLGNYSLIRDRAQRMRANSHLTLVSVYEYKKNRIRFPSCYSVKEEYVMKGKRKMRIVSPHGDTKQSAFTFSETQVIYRDYQFFTVDVEVKY